jgi:hypothetical protein
VNKTELLQSAGLKISFTGPSDKMSGDVEFSFDLEISLNDTNE